MKKKVINITLIILTIGMIYEVYSYFNMKQDNKVLENFKEVDVFDNKNKTLSIKVQSGSTNDFTWYDAADRTKWPDKTQYTYVGTKCVDASNQDVGDTKQYVNFNENTYTATITTKKTIYCTLYFGKGRPALEVLDNQGGVYYGSGTTLGQGVKGSRKAVEGLYRFKGDYDKVTNNFVCIGGPLNPDTCGSADGNKYLYRIIGVTDGTEKSTLGLDAGMLKVIKVIPSSTSQAWATTEYSNFDWDNEDNVVRPQLNGTGFYDTLDAGIKSIIPSVKWWKGSVESLKSEETKTRVTEHYKIGLMYQSDYYNSWTYAQNTNSWLHVTHTMSGKTSAYVNKHEWTMSWYGENGRGLCLAWIVQLNGTSVSTAVSGKLVTRPVFFLPSTTGLIGNGTETSPYVITSLSNA